MVCIKKDRVRFSFFEIRTKRGPRKAVTKVSHKINNHNDSEHASVEVTIAAAPADDISKPDNSGNDPAAGAAAGMSALVIAEAAAMITKKKKEDKTQAIRSDRLKRRSDFFVLASERRIITQTVLILMQIYGTIYTS